MTNHTLYLNGEFLPASEAKISVFDRGFLFGDGVYELIPVYGSHLFRLDEHIKRLENSLIQVRIAPPLSKERWRAMLSELVQLNGGGDLSIYIQITRGVAPREHAFPLDATPTILAMTSPLKPVDSTLLSTGVGVITLDDFRWLYCDIKAISLLSNVLARQEAVDMGAMEAVFIRDGWITEGAASNIFMVKNREIITPPKSSHLLPGVTRDLVLELARSNRIPCHEQPINLEHLQNADEIWLTSSGREILPVTKLNGHSVGSGFPGPLWSRTLALYQDYKRTFRNQNEDAA